MEMEQAPNIHPCPANLLTHSNSNTCLLKTELYQAGLQDNAMSLGRLDQESRIRFDGFICF